MTELFHNHTIIYEQLPVYKLAFNHVPKYCRRNVINFRWLGYSFTLIFRAGIYRRQPTIHRNFAQYFGTKNFKLKYKTVHIGPVLFSIGVCIRNSCKCKLHHLTIQINLSNHFITYPRRMTHTDNL